MGRLSDMERQELRTVTSLPLGELEIEERASLYRFCRLGFAYAVGLRNRDTASITDEGREALEARP